ncbi:hypothetical protein TrST_g8047 [Triparma strigata]|uniref:Epidermal growth factor-like domain-containing protein n=1 Tax=Triparma strigata TaxID=1606541 RepID=A0A9W7AK71_9STRA|nr:hypothetical protein TrST_g8047 [Triparma strigata]
MFEINNNCTYGSWDTIASDCSGHGECSGNGLCLCNSGYTGASDFVNLKDHDCHINITLMKVLWSIASAFALVAVVQIVRALRMSYRSLNRTGMNRQQRQKHGITHVRRQFFYRPSTRILICLCIFNLGTIMFAIRRIPNADKVVTPSRLMLWIGLTFLIIPAGFWGTTLMARLILNLSLQGLNLKASKPLNDSLKLLYKRLIIKGYFDHFSIIIMGSIGLIGGESDSYGLYSSMYFCIQGWIILSFLTYNVFFTQISSTISIAFHNSPDTKEINAIKTRIQRLMPIARIITVLFSFLALVFVVYPPLYKQWAYFWLGVSTAVAFLSIFASHVFLVKKRESVNTVTLRGEDGKLNKSSGVYKSSRFNSSESTFKKTRTPSTSSSPLEFRYSTNPIASVNARKSYAKSLAQGHNERQSDVKL